jgi:hypothetical protein
VAAVGTLLVVLLLLVVGNVAAFHGKAGGAEVTVTGKQGSSESGMLDG